MDIGKTGACVCECVTISVCVCMHALVTTHTP